MNTNLKKYNSRHRLWILFKNGGKAVRKTTEIQEHDTDEFKGFMDRVFHRNLHNIAICMHYLDGKLARVWLSDLSNWITGEEYEAIKLKKQQRQTRYDNSRKNQTRTARPV